MAAQTYPTVGVKFGNYNWGEWKSIFDLRLDEGYLEEIRRYGLGSHFFDFIELSDRTIPITTRTPKVFELLEWECTVKLGTVIAAGAAGATVTFDVHADDIDASGAVPLTEGDGIVVPAEYQTPGEDRIYVVTDITVATVTAVPLSNAGTYITASQVATNVPVGSVLKIHASYWGPGTGQPEGSRTSRATRTYYTALIKSSMGYEGGMQSIKWRDIPTEGGATSPWIEGQELIENQHTKKIDDTLFLGELNDNAALTQASNFGGTNARLATKGLWNWAEEAGQELLYPGVWDYTNLYDWKDLALSQNLVGRDVIFLYGSDLGRMIEESSLEFIKEYSGGSDLMITANKIGINVKYHMANGCMFMFQELASFGNPLRYGNKVYNFSKYGLMMPDQKESVTIDGKTERAPNLVVGYLAGQGENRKRILSLQDGMSGRSMGLNQYDGSHLYLLSEIAPLVFRPNQLVTVKPQ